MTSPEPVQPLARLEDALGALGDALAAADLNGLLEAETRIAAALEASPGAGTPPSPEAVERTRAALLRCRRLGASLDEFLRASFEALGVQPAYSRAGATQPAVRAGSIIARV